MKLRPPRNTSFIPIAMAPYIRGLVSRATRLRSTIVPRLYKHQHLPRTLSSWSLFSPLSPKGSSGHHHHHHRQLSCLIGTQQQRNISSTGPAVEEPTESTSALALDALPVCCPGCGAYAQTVEPTELGYYSESRRRKFSVERQQKPDTEEQEVDNPDESKDEGEVAAETIENALRVAEKNEGKAPRPKRMLSLEYGLFVFFYLIVG